MSITSVETFIRNARQQVSQRDIVSSLLKAIDELTREVKRMDDDVRRIRREVNRRY